MLTEKRQGFFDPTLKWEYFQYFFFFLFTPMTLNLIHLNKETLKH